MPSSPVAAKKATRQHTKQHNTRLVLKTIYETGDVSRAELARKTSLTRATVSSIVSDLIEDGLVEETGQGPSLGGKPPILLNLADNARQLICLDLGSGQFVGSVVNLRGRFVHQIEIPTDNCTGDEALAVVFDLIEQLMSRATAPILGIALGSPGLIDTRAGVIQHAVNLDWHELPLQQLLEERFDCPAYVANDSHLAALAEYSFGDGRMDNLVLIKMSHGLGSGIVLNGRLFYGEGFGAGEIGHVTVVENGLPCSCGNTGCLETVASIRAMVQQAQRLAEAHPHSLLNDEPVTWSSLCRAYRAADPQAEQIIELAADKIGLAVANLVGVLNVRHIRLSGSIADLGEDFLVRVKNSMRGRVFPILAADTVLAYATSGTNLVLLGASALILSQDLGVI
ncbi:MAG: ROK family transcriptional regulator [Ardenticatenaceae bacterium]|nr:ROK family transcriptional regulator [Ardenticatenaceae bacterium]